MVAEDFYEEVIEVLNGIHHELKRIANHLEEKVEEPFKVQHENIEKEWLIHDEEHKAGKPVVGCPACDPNAFDKETNASPILPKGRHGKAGSSGVPRDFRESESILQRNDAVRR